LIDLHCHILPGIDDGAADTAESIAMAQMAVADGIRGIVATPHTLNDAYCNPLQTVCDHVRRLKDVLAEARIDLALYCGSDAHLCMDLAERVRSGEVATINENGRYLLIEFPFQTIPEHAKEAVFQLRLAGLTPVITHPERQAVFQYAPERLKEWVDMGCLVQVTGMSITGGFGQDAMACAHRLLSLRLAHVIASDAHSAGARPPVLSAAVAAAAQILNSKQEAMAMVSERPRAILDGNPVEVPEMRTPGRKWWRFW